jgi:heme-degrading monooxygenase HmoA
MICRVAVFERAPEARPWVVEAAAAVPGCRGAYHLRARSGEKGLSITFWDDEQAAEAGAKAISEARPEGYEGRGPDEVQFYEVIKQG